MKTIYVCHFLVIFVITSYFCCLNRKINTLADMVYSNQITTSIQSEAVSCSIDSVFDKLLQIQAQNTSLAKIYLRQNKTGVIKP